MKSLAESNIELEGVQSIARTTKPNKTLYNAIGSKFIYEPDVDEQNYRTPKYLLREGRGNCVSGSILTSSVLMSKGIPHKFVFGANFENEPNHVWVETDKYIFDTVSGRTTEQPHFVEGNFNKPLNFLYKYEYPIKIKNMQHRILNGHESVEQWMIDSSTMTDSQIIATAPMEVLEQASYMQTMGEIDIVNQPNNLFGFANIANGLLKAGKWIIGGGKKLVKGAVTVARKLIPFIPSKKSRPPIIPATVGIRPPDSRATTGAEQTARVSYPDSFTSGRIATGEPKLIFGMPQLPVLAVGGFLLWRMMKPKTTKR